MTIGPKRMYDCPCGKQHKSRDTVRRHKQKMAQKTDAPPVRSDATDRRIIKLDLKEEYHKMTEKVEPKKQESTEPKYECGKCGTKFNEKMKYCPGCGCEF